MVNDATRTRRGTANNRIVAPADLDDKSPQIGPSLLWTLTLSVSGSPDP